MVMDNEQIERMFDGFKGDIKDLKEQFKDNIVTSTKDHKEIRDWLHKLCDRMTSAENTIDNHLINTAKKEKSMREKILLTIAIIGSIFGTISVLSRLLQ